MRKAGWTLFVLLTVAACATTQPTPMDLRHELETMFDSDQSHRMEIQDMVMKGDTKSPQLKELMKQQQSIDEANLKRLKEIVDSGGWPKLSVVGKKAAMAAFLIVQHADLETQKKYLPLLTESVAAGEARPEDLAFLEDRVLMREGKKQRYGSQLQPNGSGGWEFYPIEDETHVDERRKAVNLPPLKEYAKIIGIDYP
jgi:hypothetical protein